MTANQKQTARDLAKVIISAIFLIAICTAAYFFG
jgi:hypothetical protein